MFQHLNGTLKTKRLADYVLTLGERKFVPIIIGGMGVDISTAELALEAARLGGIGHVSDAMSPCVSDKSYRTVYQSTKRKRFAEFVNSDDKSQVKWLAKEVYDASKRYVETTMSRKRGEGGIFINIMEKLTMGAPTETLQARLHAALDGGIDGITLSAGLHTGTMKLIEDNPRFRDAKIGIIVSSHRALKIFLRGAAKTGRLPDYVVVEGPLAGGHLGFGEDWAKYDLRTIVSDVVQFQKEEGLTIPVVAAGGVFTGSDAVGMMDLGASAVQVATRFTISRECGLPERVKQEYLRAEERDVVVNFTSPTGYPMRMLSYSPSLFSNVKPNCEALGYLLDREGNCSYRDAYAATPVDEEGEKLPVREKMCICYHFMKYNCYTCGHYVYRLKETTSRLADGSYYLPAAEHIFTDYLSSLDHVVSVARPQVDSTAALPIL